MHRFAVIGAGLLSIAGFMGSASAADLAAQPYTRAPSLVAPVPDYWTGFYVGGNAGGMGSRGCWTLTSVAGVAIANTPNEGCQTSTGLLAGGQVGYRWQASNWVFGVEAQGDWANLTGSNSSLTALVPYMNQTKINGLGLFTGQVGYAWYNVLWYLKGGAAVTVNNYSSFFSATTVPFNAASDTRWGGAVGTGIEVGFAPNWSVAVEYDHLFMGSPSITFPATAIAVGRVDKISQGVDIGTLRVNYRFGGPIVARY